MRVLKLNCRDYRNIENLELIPDSGMNVICGENAQGKTNILEAIWLFTGAKSFRGAKDQNFIRFSKEKAELNLLFEAEGIEKTAKIEVQEKRTAYLQENKLKSPSNLAGKFNAVVFSPQDLRIVTDGPNIRRKFLDTAIGQSKPAYIEILKNYMRAVTQRNKIIKDIRNYPEINDILDSFEEKIAEKGEKIIKKANE